MLVSKVALFCFTVVNGASSYLIGRAGCSSKATDCSPPGATNREIPVLGGDWAFFYQSLISTIPSSPDTKAPPSNVDGVVAEGPIRRTLSGSLCCAATTECMLIKSYNLPACYDRFTTDYYLDDGSYGTVSNGSYTTADGGTADLITGDFTLADGTKGNIYANDPADKPDTATLPMPTPFTSSGVGSAIPASKLGSVSPTTISNGPITISTASSLTDSSTARSANTVSGPGIVPPFVTQTVTASSLTLVTTGTGNGGFPNGTGTAASGTAVGSSGAHTINGYPTSSILPPITNVAAVSLIYCFAPKLVLSILAAILVG